MNLDGAYGREGAKELEGIDQIPSEQGAFLEQTPQVSISTSFQIARCSQGLPGFSTISKRIFCLFKVGDFFSRIGTHGIHHHLSKPFGMICLVLFFQAP